MGQTDCGRYSCFYPSNKHSFPFWSVPDDVPAAGPVVGPFAGRAVDPFAGPAAVDPVVAVPEPLVDNRCDSLRRTAGAAPRLMRRLDQSLVKTLRCCCHRMTSCEKTFQY